jgi:glycosyltransferase involved in cell wall biosynthesis
MPGPHLATPPPGPPPRVSIILCVYNHGRLLGRAVESVLAQSLDEWDLVIANDGSTDDSGEVAARYAATSERIRSIDLEHGGLAAAVNAAFRLTTGPLLTSLDADDYYREGHLEDNLRYLDGHPDADLVMSRAEVLGDPYVVDLETPGRMIHLDRCAIGGTFFVRRSVFAALGGMPAAGFGMDYYFARRVEEAGYRIHRRQARTYVYDRTRGGSMTKAEEARVGGSRSARLPRPGPSAAPQPERRPARRRQ